MANVSKFVLDKPALFRVKEGIHSQTLIGENGKPVTEDRQDEEGKTVKVPVKKIFEAKKKNRDTFLSMIDMVARHGAEKFERVRGADPAPAEWEKEEAEDEENSEEAAVERRKELNENTKEELIEYAETEGIDLEELNAHSKKADIVTRIMAVEAEQNNG